MAKKESSNSTYDKLIKFLDDNNAQYRLIDHPPEGRTEIVSPMRGNELSQAAKCIVIMVKLKNKTTKYVLAVFPGDAKVNLDAIKKIYDGTYASFATTDIAEKLAGSVSGTVLPFSFNEKLELVVDPILLDNEEIFFNAARLDQSMALRTSDYKKLIKPRYENIALYSDELSEEDLSLKRIRHSLAHVLAQAVMDMFPEAKLGMGPDIDDGFYYDFELPRTLIPEDLPLLEKKMKHIIKQNQEFKKFSEPMDKSLQFLKKIKQDYKIELAKDLKGEGAKEVIFYENGPFVDMCQGPHVDKTGEIPLHCFKLHRIAGAYWKGDEKNPMLQRVYGLAFEDKEKLDAYVRFLEEQAKRDHRKLGRELDIYTMDEDIGAGLALWMPNGTVIRDELEKLAKEYEWKDGYERVATPHICKEKIYLTSGHLPYYADSMFPPMDVDGEKYYLKPMNCPHHHKIYAARPRSYQDLPVRLAEYGQCYRYEDSGALFGLMRVRGFCMNDAHIYTTPDQLEEEFIKVINLHEAYYKLLGIEKIEYELALHSKEGLGKKYFNDEKLWKKAEDDIRKAMKKTGVTYKEVEDEAAFYGPKIDVQIYSVIGRQFTVGTNQLDFSIPEKFGLTYVGKDGKEHTPVCIHRAPLSTHERFIGFLIEHFAGAFPTWLAPVQVEVIPVAAPHEEYARNVLDELKKNFIRAEYASPEETLGKRIRASEMKKVPYMLVIGDKEINADKLNVRSYKDKTQKSQAVKAFVKRVLKEINERSL
jgi:threonyl-tRNA synthetase